MLSSDTPITLAPAAVTPMGRANFPSIRSMVEADLRGWLPVMGVDLPEDLILAILAEAERLEADGWIGPNARSTASCPAPSCWYF